MASEEQIGTTIRAMLNLVMAKEFPGDNARIGANFVELVKIAKDLPVDEEGQ